MFHASAIMSLMAILMPILASGQSLYQPCPLLRAYYPAPTLDKASDTIQSFAQKFTDLFNDLIAEGGSDDFGAITPNTTSFSVVLFSDADSSEGDAIFFEYYHTATALEDAHNVSSQTVFPVGGLTQLFTVYTWLVETGAGSWESPITEFLPDLNRTNTNQSEYDIEVAVDWASITVGSLSSHMSGLVRDSNACSVFENCNKQKFLDVISSSVAYFQPDTTAVISNAAFQLLAYAIEAQTGQLFSDVLSISILDPLDMTQTSLLNNSSQYFAQSLPLSLSGEPASLSLTTSAADLAKAGQAILSNRLLRPSQSRHWLQPAADTSNLRNGVGRPWEIYHAGQYANSSILDVYTKSGSLGAYSSYFGLVPDFGVGFAILAHDTEAREHKALDLNVYADVVSGALSTLEQIAAEQTAGRFAGAYAGTGTGRSRAVLNATTERPGLVIQELVVDGNDVRGEVAAEVGIALESLDLRLYPSNVVSGNLQQFVAVIQDRDAPVDMGTPTCITWMSVGDLGRIPTRFVFEMDDSGVAVGLRIPGRQVRLDKV